MLNGVDHIIARHGVHTQARQVGVDGDVTFARTGAVAVGDGRSRSDCRCRGAVRTSDGTLSGPPQIALHRRRCCCHQSSRLGVARFGIRHGAADGLACRHFRRVNPALSPATVLMVTVGSAVIDQQVRTVAHAVAHAVGTAVRSELYSPDEAADRRPEPSNIGYRLRRGGRGFYRSGSRSPRCLLLPLALVPLTFRSRPFSTAFRTLSSVDSVEINPKADRYRRSHYQSAVPVAPPAASMTGT